MKYVADKKAHFSLLSILKNPKIGGLIILGLLVLVGLPLTLLEVSTVQETRNHAYFNQYNNYYDKCGLVRIDAVEPKACSQGTSSYGTGAKLSIENSKYTGSHSVHWIWYSFFCLQKNGDGDHNQCDENSATHVENVWQGTAEVKYGSPVTVYASSDQSSSNQGQNTPASFSYGQYNACGTYQNDFIIDKIDGNTGCTYGKPDPSGIVDNNHNNWITTFWGGCATGVQCAAPTPTPTPTPTPSPSPSPSLSPTPTPTATPTDTPTVTPTDTPTPTPTDTPTVTPTDTPTPTQPPTGTPVPPGYPTCKSLTADRSTTGVYPYSLTFTGTASSNDNPITKAIFTFGDGQSTTLTQGGTLGSLNASVPTSHTYKNKGTYLATVEFFDQLNHSTGIIKECSLTISVITPPPGGQSTPAPSQPPSNPIPKTGPGDVFAQIGIVGAAIILVGGIIAFGL